MRIVLAPDKFKGCLTAAEVCDAMAAGIRSVDPTIEIDPCPMADGGEGTVDALVAATGGRIVSRRVTGPLPSMKVDAPVGLLGDGSTAVIEMAAASGLHLLKPEQHDPTRTTTYGTGELLLAAAELGVRKIILGIGGSATTDGGIGAAQAWGARFVLKTGQSYSTGDRRLTGGDLKQLLRFDWSGASNADEEERGNGRSPRKRKLLAGPSREDAAGTESSGLQRYEPLLDPRGIEFVVACDVGNPLFGRDGAAAVFGPQKGATPEQVRELDDGLRHLAEKLLRTPLADAPGAGAAGGLGFGMMAFFGATLRPGASIVMDATRLAERLRGADVCLTGEGRLDAQSLSGKTPIAVAQLCKSAAVPCLAIAGSLGPGLDAAASQGLTAAFSICPGPLDLPAAMADAPALIAAATVNALRTFLAGRG